MLPNSFLTALTLVVTVFVATPVLADAELPAPTGQVVLTVSGAVGVTNVDGTAQLDMDMLAAMPAEEFETTTIWTKGPQVFRGVSLSYLIGTLGMSGTTLQATAINDYSVDIPTSDAVEGGPIVAYMLNGEKMHRRDKGPLWIVYPYDSKSDYRTETTYSRSIWQLDRLTVD